MKRLLNKILTGNLKKGRLAVSGVGFLLGLLIVMLSMNVYLQFQELLAKKESANFLMVSKLVKNVSFKGDAFTSNELEELSKQEFVKRLTPVYANKFGVWMDIDMLRLHTQALAEAIPDDFIDIDLPLSWRKYNRRWDPESDYIPIIVSREMINMYNLSFALSNGTPQVTDNLIYTLNGKIIIKGNGKRKVFKTSIVGLSERVNSILVPYTFLEWANENFGDGEEAKSHKVLVEVENRTDPKIQDFFEGRDYQVEKSKLINQKNLSTLYVLLFVMVVFGVAFIVFSMTIVVSNFALLIAEAQSEIVLLRTLGYTQKKIARHFFNYILKFEALVSALALLLVMGVYYFIALALQNVGFEVGQGVYASVFFLGIALFAITLFISYFSLNKTLKKKS